MKKLIVIMLCLMMMTSLIACSKSPSEEEVRGEQTTNEKTQEESEAETSEKEFSLGETDGLVYENKFIGIGCTLEDNWSFYSDEEIMELNNYTADVAGEDYEKIMEGADLVYDMYAVSGDLQNNMNVVLEKMNQVLLDHLVIEDSLEAAMPVMKETFADIGYADLQAELDTISIEGKEFTCLYTTGEINGVTAYQKTFPIKCNGYLANITITTYGEDKVDELAERFYFVE